MAHLGPIKKNDREGEAVRGHQEPPLPARRARRRPFGAKGATAACPSGRRRSSRSPCLAPPQAVASAAGSACTSRRNQSSSPFGCPTPPSARRRRLSLCPAAGVLLRRAMERCCHRLDVLPSRAPSTAGGCAKRRRLGFGRAPPHPCWALPSPLGRAAACPKGRHLFLPWKPAAAAPWPLDRHGRRRRASPPPAPSDIVSRSARERRSPLRRAAVMERPCVAVLGTAPPLWRDGHRESRGCLRCRRCRWPLYTEGPRPLSVLLVEFFNHRANHYSREQCVGLSSQWKATCLTTYCAMKVNKWFSLID